MLSVLTSLYRVDGYEFDEAPAAVLECNGRAGLEEVLSACWECMNNFHSSDFTVLESKAEA